MGWIDVNKETRVWFFLLWFCNEGWEIKTRPSHAEWQDSALRQTDFYVRLYMYPVLMDFQSIWFYLNNLEFQRTNKLFLSRANWEIYWHFLKFVIIFYGLLTADFSFMTPRERTTAFQRTLAKLIKARSILGISSVTYGLYWYYYKSYQAFKCLLDLGYFWKHNLSFALITVIK